MAKMQIRSITITKIYTEFNTTTPPACVTPDELDERTTDEARVKIPVVTHARITRNIANVKER
jgi:hypothetical protein